MKRNLTANSTSSSAIPIINFVKWRHGSPAERLAFASELADTCHQVGFFQLVGHGLEDLQLRAKAMMRDLFKLPIEQKRRIAKIHSPHFRGWEPLGTERTNGRVDYREQVDTWTDCETAPEDENVPYLRLYGPSQYFSDQVLPGYKALTQEWFSRCGRIASELLAAMAVGLDLPEDYFENTFGPANKCMSLLKWIHYPGSQCGQHGVNAHKDATFLTLLLPDGPGLEIQLLDGEWVPVEVIQTAFVVNLGECLQSLTGHYFVATPHRVLTTRERYSCAYFHGSELSYRLDEPLPLASRFAEVVRASAFHRNARL